MVGLRLSGRPGVVMVVRHTSRVRDDARWGQACADLAEDGERPGFILAREEGEDGLHVLVSPGQLVELALGGQLVSLIGLCGVFALDARMLARGARALAIALSIASAKGS